MNRSLAWYLVALAALAGCAKGSPDGRGTTEDTGGLTPDDVIADVPVDTGFAADSGVDVATDTGQQPPLDTGVPVDTGSDTGVPADTGFDASQPPRDVATDAALVDVRDVPPADTGRPCVCPTLPTTCTPPAAGTPAFSPSDDALQRQVVNLLSCADRELHWAVYEASWSCVTDALLARLAADTDLRVSLVYDDETCPRSGASLTCELSRLEGHPRVTMVPDGRSALMHHKFMIVDGARVWVASSNMTRVSFCTDANNGLVVEEASIVAAYEAEFQRMFTAREFGPITPEATPARGGAYTVYFSPRSPSTGPSPWFTEMLSAISAARSTIEVEASAWTRTEVSDALLAASRRGVRVRGVVSRIYADDPPVAALVAAGVPMRVTDVHSKVLIIDGMTVVTGSANWSANAWSNNENSLWVRDAGVASRYLADFERVYAAARPL